MKSPRYNPFRPDKLVPPGLFTGRIEEIRFIESALRQTKNGNPKHFLLVGERGIGKSSLMLLTQTIARGIENAPKNERFNFLVVNVSLRKDDTFIQIIDRIALSLKKEVQKNDVFSAFVFKSLDFISRIEAYGVKINKGSSAEATEESLAALEDDLENIILKLGDTKDGILLLIDEADGPSSDAGLGLLCKLITEEMARRLCDKVCFGIAGLPPILSKLRESHESSLRLFHIMNLKPLEWDERGQVLEAGIKDANKKNEDSTSFSEQSVNLISSFSDGYPHFLQEFAYCAFETDDDGEITDQDFLKSLFDENGAFDQLGSKYFDKTYSTPGSDDYRVVLQIMAEGFDEWISRSDIIKKGTVKQGIVDNALRAMKLKGIILQDETRPGYYRIPTRSFAVWISIKSKAGLSE